MLIKKSAMLLIALATSSVSILVFSSDKIIPSSLPVKCCQQLVENELFSPWGIMSQSMLRTKA
ncbi:hypothetical protein [Ferruginibacter sp.]|uniref:hypothetical protein n=1 Tax=Ferruginibacter sp. TaxID=1940288 RepID=UPI0019CE33BC|nr:hypothetical protein [Ferruginibacter sp.]MBC7629527.1 hypothetical protein [Ferruginibacter sp.]